MPLVMLDAGQSGIITAIGGSREFKKYMYGLGFAIGEFVTVTSTEKTGIIVGLGASRMALDNDTASKIFV